MKTKLVSTLLILSALIGIVYLVTRQTPRKDAFIGVVLPVEHPALDQIVLGFTHSVKEKLGDRVSIVVQNAHKDPHIQAAMIESFLAQHVDLLVTVATQPTLMALQKSDPQQPLLFLAANPSAFPKTSLATRKLAGVIDEFDSSLHVRLIQAVLPNLHKITIVHSIDERVVAEVNELSSMFREKKVSVQTLGIQAIADLYLVSTHISSDTDAIFILKDITVTNGIQAFIKQAELLHRPLIVSDEASVSAGAAFALGVKEEDIGTQGGALAVTLLQKAKENSSTITYPIEFIKNLQIFINPKACTKQGLQKETIMTAAAAMKLSTQLLSGS